MRWLIAPAFLIFVCPLAAQEAATVVVREGLAPASGAVVGQHVTLHIDVLFRGEMPKPPRVSLADVPGLQIIHFETQGTTIRETIGGVAYVGQRFEFALYPRRGGTLDIPPASVALFDKTGDPAGSTQGQSLHLPIRVPPGVDISQPLVATSHLTMEQHWTPAPAGAVKAEAIKAGDAIVRTVTRRAEDVPGLAMANLSTTAPEGVRVYTDPPDVEDNTNRGVVTGQRIDRITYVFEHSGTFILPSLSQSWWDLGASNLQIAEAPAMTVNVASEPTQPSTDRFASRTMQSIVLLAGSVTLLTVSAFWLRHIVVQRHSSDPERTAFNALKRACTTTDSRAIYRAFSHWISFLRPSQYVAARDAATRLQASLFSNDPGHWNQADSARLLSCLKVIRTSAPQTGIASVLPPLNP